jgi:ADP-ribosylglycohydrolase
VSRALAAFTGLAIGDALGMPTQSMPREAIQARYGVLTGFEPGPADQPIAPGMAAASITDDTEQAVLLARLLIAGDGHVDPHRLAADLLAWEEDMRRRGSLDLLGPSTKAAVSAVAAGESLEGAGRFGTTNGAAMRITPVGIAYSTDDLQSLVDSVVEASWVTHNTGVALSGAAAVAAAVSAGIAGANVREATKVAAEAAKLAAGRGNWIAAGDVGTRLAWASELVEGMPPGEAADLIYRLVGTSVATQESVPAAFAVLAVHPDDPWRACLLAASLGGDCDTIAAMAGAIAGACHGDDAFPEEAVRTLHAVNDLPLAELTEDLVALRT